MKILRKIPALAVMTVSWILSSRSTVPMPDFKDSDKVVHVICFAALAFCWTLWFSAESWWRHPVRNILIAVAIVSAYGIIDEYHQSFVPGRDASVFDWAADTIGAAIGSAAGYAAAVLSRKLRQRKRVTGR